jgi:putative glutamine amidotransferase
VSAVEESWAIPYIIPCNVKHIDHYIQAMDGFIFPGWADIDPSLYNADNNWSEDFTKKNDEFLLNFMRECLDKKKKILVICKWMQLLNVLQGWTLIQHLENAQQHNQYQNQYLTVDTVTPIYDSFLCKAFWKDISIPINSLHHQAVNSLWKDLMVVARSDFDNTIEAIEHIFLPAYWVQWHPESIIENRKLFEWFVKL